MNNRPMKEVRIKCSRCIGNGCSCCTGTGYERNTDPIFCPMSDLEWIEYLEERVSKLEELLGE